MTGTSSCTATAALRGVVGRKPYAKLWLEVHEPHTRRPPGGEGSDLPKARCHPDWGDVDAAGIWSEGRVPYPGRPAFGQESAEAVVAASTARRRAERRETDRHVKFAV